MPIQSAKQSLRRRFGDPVFICMAVAMVLAVASSIMLRSVAGPAPARAGVQGTELGTADESALPADPALHRVHPK